MEEGGQEGIREGQSKMLSLLLREQSRSKACHVDSITGHPRLKEHLHRARAGLNAAGKEVRGLQEAAEEGLLRGIWTPAKEWLKERFLSWRGDQGLFWQLTQGQIRRGSW